MIVGKDAVRRLDTAIARLATAGYGDFTRAARKLSAVLQSPEFAPTCGELTRDVDIEAFLKLSGDQHENLGDPLPLPDDTVAEMGIVICLIDYLGASEAEIADDIIFNHYGTGASIETAWQQFVKKVVLPFRNDLIDHLSALGRLAAQSAPPASNISINVHDSQGVAIQHGSPGAVQTVAQHIDSAAANPALEALATTLSSVAVAPAMRADLDAELDTIRAQLKKTTPNAVVLRESGKTLRALVESIAGNLATPYLVTLGAALWKHLV